MGSSTPRDGGFVQPFCIIAFPDPPCLGKSALYVEAKGCALRFLIWMHDLQLRLQHAYTMSEESVNLINKPSNSNSTTKPKHSIPKVFTFVTF